MKPSLGLLFGLIALNVNALPSTLNEKVTLTSYSCGGDGCYLNMELYNTTGVTFQTWCSHKSYCDKLHTAYENKGSDLEFYQTAKVQLKRTIHEFSGSNIYETVKITPVED